MDSVFYYIEASVFCMILLSIFFYKTITSLYREQQQIFFAKALFSQILYIVSDIIWILQYKHIIVISPYFYFLLNLTQWFLASSCGYHWFIYSESLRKARYVENTNTRRLIFLPVWIASITLLSSFLFAFPMRVNPDGSFDGMGYYSYMMILPFLYIGFAGFRCLQQYFVQEKADRQLLTSALYPIMLITAGFVQALLLEIPLLCYAFVLDMLVYYIFMQDTQISQDSLTQLNNRNSLYRILRNRFRDNYSDEIFYLFMLDIDYFKSINDTYGHQEGDRALKRLADSLRTVCKRQRENSFIARYGGDEFMLLFDCQNDAEAFQITQQIQREVRLRNKKANSPYDMEVSIGYIRRDSSVNSVSDLIRLADQKLYRYKHVQQPDHKFVKNRA